MKRQTIALVIFNEMFYINTGFYESYFPDDLPTYKEKSIKAIEKILTDAGIAE